MWGKKGVYSLGKCKMDAHILQNTVIPPTPSQEVFHRVVHEKQNGPPVSPSPLSSTLEDLLRRRGREHERRKRCQGLEQSGMAVSKRCWEVLQPLLLGPTLN